MVDDWQLLYTKDSQKDAKKIAAAGLKRKALELLEIIAKNPFKNPPACEKFVGDLHDAYSRINIKHRLVYQVRETEHVIVILRMWSHYEWTTAFYAKEIRLKCRIFDNEPGCDSFLARNWIANSFHAH